MVSYNECYLLRMQQSICYMLQSILSHMTMYVVRKVGCPLSVARFFTPKRFISYRTATNNNVVAYINKVLLLSVYNGSAEGREQITTKRYHRN